jgi:hypothetical protein
MKKLIPLFLLAFLVALTVPALAGNGDVQWAATKTITLTEKFDYSESVHFTTIGTFLFDGEAWAKIQEQQELYALLLQVDVIPGVRKQANITDNAFNDATGIANVNQSPGNMNNQGNEVAFSTANNATGTDNPAATNTFQGMYCEAQVVSVQYNGILFEPNNPAADNTPALGGTRLAQPNSLLYSDNNLSDQIASSFNNFSGIANVNQAAGYLNNQGNAVAIAGGIAQPGAKAQSVVKAATDVILAQASAFNVVADGNRPGETTFPGSNADDSITNSFGAFTGVANVNQASGVVNNQKNIVAISFAGQSPK